MIDHNEILDQGYTIFRPLISEDTAKKLRQFCIREALRSSFDRGWGEYGFSGGDILWKSETVSEIAADPRLFDAAQAVLGMGATLSQVTYSVRCRGSHARPLHTDNKFVPAPFPGFPLYMTAEVALQDTSAEDGAPVILPYSNAELREPMNDEDRHLARLIELRAGESVIWQGHTWQGNRAKSSEGYRVCLRFVYTRLFVRPHEDLLIGCNRDLDSLSAEARGLLGIRSLYGHIPREGLDW